MDERDRYGSPEHEAWLLECEREEEGAPYYPDHPYTPCGCIARAYGGDCAHTLAGELEELRGQEA